MSAEYCNEIEPPGGRDLFPQPEREEAAVVAALARRILQPVPADTQRELLQELHELLNAFAGRIGRRRDCIQSGACVSYVWLPAQGGPARGDRDIEIFGCEEMRAHLPFALYLRQTSKDLHRAFLRGLSLIVLRDFENGDYAAVVAARRTFDIWHSRLISTDQVAHEQRRQAGRHRGVDESKRAALARDRVLEHARRLGQTDRPRSEWVATIDNQLERGSDKGYPGRQTIRRILKKAHLLP